MGCGVGGAQLGFPGRFAALLALLLVPCALAGPPPPPASAGAARVVSLNPSLTAILLALGARDVLVGVDDFSAQAQPELAGLAKVGGLYDPSLEAVAALAPDLVVLVPSVEQREFRGRLEELGIPVLAISPLSFDQVLGSIETLGARTGRAEAAKARVAAIRRVRQEVEEEAAGRPRPRAVLVLQREPLFVVGGGSFIDEMMRAAGAENLGAQFPEPYPRVSLEWLVAARPEVILDASSEPGTAREFWSQWPSLPALSAGRVLALPPGVVTLPGPYLDRALRVLADALAPAARAAAAKEAAGSPP